MTHCAAQSILSTYHDRTCLVYLGVGVLRFRLKEAGYYVRLTELADPHSTSYTVLHLIGEPTKWSRIFRNIRTLKMHTLLDQFGAANNYRLHIVNRMSVITS